MNATALPKPGVKMTIDVYTVNQHGEVIEDRGTVVTMGSGKGLMPTGCAWPPCACPRCRAGQEETR
ncbi:hypothetical protein ACIF9R_37245 [Streptomyces sp. NPDC086080]|uniref:hypothetical protein n=1 Tax=Streptomyces sp. NPDC086080 TaxID=3365748 RepID=UPI0037D0934A